MFTPCFVQESPWT